MARPPAIIDGDGVRLRRVAPDDAAALFQAADDAEVMRYMDWAAPAGVAEIAAHIERVQSAWEEGREFQWVIADPATNAVVGTISCRPHGHAADFGYFVARRHWGHGLATTAASSVLGWLWHQPAIVRVWATADAENLRSRRLLERLGLRLEGIMRRATLRPNLGGPPRDTALYARCRDDG